MKHTVTGLLSLLALASCSHYEAPDLQPIKDKTFTGENLVLYYNGEPMPNKSITVTQEGDKATAKLFGEFDLSQLSAFGLSGTIPAPGILPGEETSTLNLTMSNAGEYWDFTGSGENDACTFNYKGYANDERMALFLSEVKLKIAGITPNVWKPAPISVADGVYSSLPFFINWKYDPIPGVDFDLTPYMEALATTPIIPVYNNTAYMSLSQAISQLLQTIALKEDGNLIVTYLSTVGGAMHIAQTLPNRFMYTLDSPTRIRLYLNPTALFGMILVAGSTGTPSDDIKIIGNGMYPSGHVTPTEPGVIEAILKSELGKKVAKSALSVILPQLAQGLPFDISESDNQLQFCIDNQVAMGLLQQIVTPLLADDETVKAIVAYIESNANLKPLLPLLSKALELLPEAIERTNHLQLGLAFVPYTK